MVDKSDASVGENQPRKNMEQGKTNTSAVKGVGKKVRAKKKICKKKSRSSKDSEN